MSKVAKRLITEGECRFKVPYDPGNPYPFSKNENSDKLLNDLDNHPHAFVIACLMDQQSKAEQAWLPQVLKRCTGTPTR